MKKLMELKEEYMVRKYLRYSSVILLIIFTLFITFKISDYSNFLYNISSIIKVDTSKISESIKLLTLDRGAAATFISIFVASYLANRHFKRWIEDITDKVIRDHVIAVSENVRLHKVKGGLYSENTRYHRYVAMWRLVGAKGCPYDQYKLVILFRICSSKNEISEVINSDCPYCWWDHKVTIKRAENDHSIVIEASNDKRSTGFITDVSGRSRASIRRAMKRIQMLDEKEILECKNNLCNSCMRDIPDDYLIKPESQTVPDKH